MQYPCIHAWRQEVLFRFKSDSATSQIITYTLMSRQSRYKAWVGKMWLKLVSSCPARSPSYMRLNFVPYSDCKCNPYIVQDRAKSHDKSPYQLQMVFVIIQQLCAILSACDHFPQCGEWLPRIWTAHMS